MSHHHQQPLSVAIVGAGPGGLTLASILHRRLRVLQDRQPTPGKPRWVATIYEADANPAARPQGGTLDLGKKSGLRAIAAAGLSERFQALARPEGQELRILRRSGDAVFHRAAEDVPAAASDDYSPEIDRVDLLRILRDSLPENAIRWGHKLVTVDECQRDVQQVPSRDGGAGPSFALTFANGNVVPADLVVGADGAWSRVRSLVTDVSPTDSGATFLDCALGDFDRRFPELVDVVGRGSLYAYGGGATLITQRNSHGVLRVYLGVRATPADPRSTSQPSTSVMTDGTMSNRERAETLARTTYAEWGPRMQALVRAAGSGDPTTEPMVPRVLHALPVGFSWPHRRGVTLLGDAAHLMSPCAGEGVNMAMLDALELAEAIAGGSTDAGVGLPSDSSVWGRLAEYEAALFSRVRDAARRSRDNLELFMTAPDAASADIARMFGLPSESEISG